jgi:hypothetical protein
MDVKKYEKMMREGNFLNIWAESSKPTRRAIKTRR